ncbi:cytochrome P450 [Aeromicrobium piscarium]|uniref:Cytochrome P450 n=1 Tax=Aeromicrobium piscarium TaxID=2590901 RepID=A0A554RMC6_9ACTN|nr:cytochrome P450 [Aeromicrobium piscarium]TSD55285.1 cytochrome P450 [Aeromicrobium piscarium]
MNAVSNVPSSSLDPFSAEYRADPYGSQAELRSLGPVVRLEKYDVWACPRYDEVMEILRLPEQFRSGAGVGLSDLTREKHWRKPSILLENDPPHHTRVRNALNKVLTARNIRRLRDAFEERAVTVVDGLASKSSFDGVAELARPFPLDVFPDAVGLTADDRENLLAYGRMVFDGMGPRNEIWEEVMEHAEEVTSWITAQCRREALTPGGLGDQVYATVDEGQLDEEEAALVIRSFLSAGVDTTIFALGTALLCFANNPDQWDYVREDPSKRIRPAFEEVLRYESPFQMYFRTSTKRTELAGATIEEGDKLLVMVASANRDPGHWDEPERFDASRSAVGHVAFGHGIHTCVGQMIARLEAETLLGELARRVERIELTGEPVWQPANTLRGLAELPLTISPARGA